MSLKLIKFSASWCAPCESFQPIWEQLIEEVLGEKDIEFVAIDIDEDPEAATRYGVMSIPTLLFIKDGAVVNTLVGLHKKSQILGIINSLVKTG